MIDKNAARMMFVAAFLLAAPVFAQEQTEGGKFYAACGPTDGPATTIETDSHLRITIYGTAKADEAYRTQKELFEGQQTSMQVELCDKKMDNCKPVEGVLTMYKADGETIEAAIELTSEEFLRQGDAESPQGEMHSFTVTRDKAKTTPVCG